MQPPEDDDGVLDRHSGAERLDSWKAIADYLSRDVRTVQRWEKSEGLPVHRHVHEKLSSVYAYQSELEHWLAAREEPDADVAPARLAANEIASATGVGARHDRTSSRRLRVWAGVGLGAVAVLVVLGTPWLKRSARDAAGPASPAEPRPPSWILVSDFAGPDDDADLAAAVRELVVASLTNSDAATPISRSQMRAGLRLALLPDSTRVAGEIARQLASRASARVYIEGRIDRIQSGYSIVLHIQDAETSAIVASVRGVAEREADLITTLDQLGRDLRERIGENRARVRANRPFVEVITPSFEAYRKHVQQTELHLAGEHRGSLRLGYEAVHLDPDFALAFHQIGTTHSSLGVLDSAQFWWKKALARPNRLTETQQLGLRALMAVVLDRDLDEFIRLQTLVIQQRHQGYNNLGVALGLLGRYEDALTAFQNAEVETPFGAEQLHLANEFNMLLRLGRIDEARAVVPELQGHYRRSADVTLALAESRWTAADRLAAAQVSDDTATPLMRYWARQTRASIAAVRGNVDAAEAALTQLVDSSPNPASKAATRFALVHLRTMRGQPAAEAAAAIPTRRRRTSSSVSAFSVPHAVTRRAPPNACNSRSLGRRATRDAMPPTSSCCALALLLRRSIGTMS